MFYVYALIDPRTDEVFYIGKGTGKRMYAHEKEARRGKISNQAKYLKIKSILDDGYSVEYKVLRHLEDEDAAYQAEVEEILAHAHLTNANKGGGGSFCGVVSIKREADKARQLLDKMLDLDVWLNSISEWQRKAAIIVGGSPEACYHKIRNELGLVVDSYYRMAAHV